MPLFRRDTNVSFSCCSSQPGNPGIWALMYLSKIQEEALLKIEDGSLLGRMRFVLGSSCLKLTWSNR